MSLVPDPPHVDVLANGSFTLALDPLWLQVYADTQQDAVLLLLAMLPETLKRPHADAEDVPAMRDFVATTSAVELILWAGGDVPDDPEGAIKQAARDFKRAQRAEEADGFRSEPADGGDPYFDFETDAPLAEDLRSIVDQVVQHPRMDFIAGIELVSDIAGHLSPSEKEKVAGIAYDVFAATVGADLNRRARRRVRAVAKRPDFVYLPPLLRGAADTAGPRQDYQDELADEDPRVVRLFRLALSELYTSPKADRARAKVEADAVDLFETLPPLVRDQLVLTTRIWQRESLLEPYMIGEARRRMEWLAYRAKHHATQVNGESVQQRYDTAARRLLVQGHTSAASAAALGVSEYRLVKMMREWPDDIALRKGDCLNAVVGEIE